jgi:hypothetical protein
MMIRSPYPTLRRDFGDRSWTLELAKANVGRVIATRAIYHAPALHQALDKSETLDGGRSVSGRATSGAERYAEKYNEARRWRARSTLLLILSVGTLFWGSVFWLFFG